MRVWLMVAAMALLPGLLRAAAPASYTVAFKDAPGCQRQYQCSLLVSYRYQQLIDGSAGGSEIATESWTARETVQGNEQGKATLKYWVTGGTHGAKIPGRLRFVALPSRLPNEEMRQYTVGYTRTAEGAVSGVECLGGKMPLEHTATPYGPFYAQLFPFALALKLPRGTLTEGDQWNDTIPVSLISPGIKGAQPKELTRTFTFVGPQTLEGKRYLVITAEINSGELPCKIETPVKGRKITFSGTYRLSGKTTIYFDEEAGEVYRVTIDGTCSSRATVSTNRKSDGGAYEEATAKFSGAALRTPLETPAAPK